MNKQEIAEIFEEIALLLEMKGENPFRVRAYRNGARSLLNADQDLKRLVREGKLTELEGIGSDLAEKIETLATKGRLPFYEKLKRSVPKGLLHLRQIRGLGAKKIKILHEKLKIGSADALQRACQKGLVAKLKGFGKKTEQNILTALRAAKEYAEKRLWWDAAQIAIPFLEKLKKVKGVKRAEIAGSVRRKCETVGDLDFVVASRDPKRVMQWFTSEPSVKRILAQGETQASVVLQGGLQADLRVVTEEEFGFALIYFTGSKEHNIKLREKALKKGWSLSEYGLALSGKRGRLPPLPKSASEEEIYRVFGLSWIPPELRENRGEFLEAIPQLVEVKDIRGTLHNHTTESDGKSNLKEMVRAAEQMGWEYLGISDHSKSSVQANGLSEERLKKQIATIEMLNQSKEFRPFVLAGIECDILPDGKLDCSETLLKQLDFAIVSIHSALSQDEKTTTARLIRAIEHPYTTIVGHVTGRLLLRRDPYKVNVEKVIDACIANRKIIELNGNPWRLDMDWRFWHKASEKGLLCCINTDAHSAKDLVYIQAGVNIARKGWLTAKQVINTLSLHHLQTFLKKGRQHVISSS